MRAKTQNACALPNRSRRAQALNPAWYHLHSHVMARLFRGTNGRHRRLKRCNGRTRRGLRGDVGRVSVRRFPPALPLWKRKRAYSSPSPSREQNAGCEIGCRACVYGAGGCIAIECATGDTDSDSDGGAMVAASPFGELPPDGKAVAAASWPAACCPASLRAASCAAAATLSHPPRRYMLLPQTLQRPLRSRPPRRLQTWIAPLIWRRARQ